MAGLYNLMFGYNDMCVLLTPMLTRKRPEEHFARFRDCFISDDDEHIEVFTRLGGGNREYYEGEIDTLRSMPTYVTDYDDDFDCTYATFTFGVPDEWRDDFEHIVKGEYDQISERYVERMQGCFENLDVREFIARRCEQ